MPVPDKINQLVETFEQNLNEYHTRKKETEFRREFLDPFFESLGWDVSNNKDFDECRKEVAHELYVELDGQQKKADYTFRMGIYKFDLLALHKSDGECDEISARHRSGHNTNNCGNRQ